MKFFSPAIPAIVLLLGCGGTVIEGAPGDGGLGDAPATETSATDSAVDSATPIEDGGVTTTGAAPPPRPGTTASGGVTKWFLVSKVYVGLTDRATGFSGPFAWKSLGYDLDRRTTTAEDSKNSINSCKRVAGSTTKVLTDGDEGRDNNFGQNVMAVIHSLKSDAEEAMNAGIAGGGTTMLLRLDNVGPDDNGSVPGALYPTLPGAARSFTPSDHIEIDRAWIDGSKEPLIQFTKGYMNKGVWVSGDLGGDRVLVSLSGIGSSSPLLLDMPRGTISFDTKTGTNGLIVGAIGHDAFMKGFKPTLTSFGICPGNATYDQVDNTVRQSNDLVLGAPSLQDTTVECNALSVAIGFDVAPSDQWLGISGRLPVDEVCK